MSDKIKLKNMEYIFELIKKSSGINLTQEKLYLLEARLLPIANSIGLSSLDALIEKIQLEPDKKLIKNVVEAMTTNETSFFRDGNPFNQLVQQILPNIVKNYPSKKIRIWSAACSTGQEPYSIVMKILESKAILGNINFEVVASDISSRVLEKAGKGIYSQFEVQRGVPTLLLLKYFGQEDKDWYIKDSVKQYVTFQQRNLLNVPVDTEKFDIIFCRNVLIYFDVTTKSRVLNNLLSALDPKGYIFIGAAENFISIDTSLSQVEDLYGVLTKR